MESNAIPIEERETFPPTLFKTQVTELMDIYPSLALGWIKKLIESLSGLKCSPEDMSKAISDEFRHNTLPYPVAPDIIRKAIEFRNRRWQHDDYYKEEPYTHITNE